MDKSFYNKRKYVSRDGEEYLNLSTPTINIKDIKVNGYIKVDKDYKGRLDKFVYTNVSKDYDAIDIIMYANNIFNPFAIDEGDILYTPIYNSDLYSKSEEPVLPDGSSLSTKDKQSLTYAQKVELLAKQGKGW